MSYQDDSFLYLFNSNATYGKTVSNICLKKLIPDLQFYFCSLSFAYLPNKASKEKLIYCCYHIISVSYKLLKCLFSSNIEEYNSKVLGKLAKQAGSGCVQGTFAPVWQALRTTAEKLSSLHMQMVQKISDLVKEVTKYAEELHKKHKSVSLFSV